MRLLVLICLFINLLVVTRSSTGPTPDLLKNHLNRKREDVTFRRKFFVSSKVHIESIKVLSKKKSNSEKKYVVSKLFTENQSTSTLHKIWTSVDILGLLVYTALAISYSFDAWNEVFSSRLKANILPVLITGVGRLLVIFGLLLLIYNDVDEDTFDGEDFIGMGMLTIGPILNLIACFLFNTEDKCIKYAWMTDEILEIVGMLFLDLSMLTSRFHRVTIFVLEMVGFVILIGASLLNIEFLENEYLPFRVSITTEVANYWDIFASSLMTVVSCKEYIRRCQQDMFKRGRRQRQTQSSEDIRGRKLLKQEVKDMKDEALVLE